MNTDTCIRGGNNERYNHQKEFLGNCENFWLEKGNPLAVLQPEGGVNNFDGMRRE